MTINFFQNINDLRELKLHYKKLVLKYHPDKFQDEDEKETARDFMKAINAEYDAITEYVKKWGKFPSSGSTSSGSSWKKSEPTEEMQAAIDAISDLEGLEIEICGSWVWVSGNTKPHKDALKSAGFRWASKKKQWYWRAEEDKKKKKGSLSMEKIREKYGSESVKSYARRERLTA